jgi:hypothetical protein
MTAGQDVLDQLPELPLEKFESIGKLVRSDHGPFLTIEPTRVEASRAAIPLPDGKMKVSATVQCHWAWVIYPIVVCHDPGEFLDGLKIAGPSSGGSDLGHHADELREVAGGVEHYRLSSWSDRKFPRPLFCTVHYGPWFGRFKDQESCIEGDYEHKIDFYLEGVQPGQGPGVVTWFGSLSDMPVVPALSVMWTTLQSENVHYAPCGGEQYPEEPAPPPA